MARFGFKKYMLVNNKSETATTNISTSLITSHKASSHVIKLVESL